MKILVIGGTQFIGRHVVQSLLDSGDDVTLFHRGRTNPSLFPHADHRYGDRNSDLAPLAIGQWDATIDVSAYIPRQVRTLAAALDGRGGHYVHISSVSAYARAVAPGLTEDAPLQVLEDPSVERVTGATYGGLKALCESAALDAFGSDSVAIVRPTYVAGPYDHTYRFTWWVERIARGGRVLAPGPSTNPFQVIDVRDLAAFIAGLAHTARSGAFHAATPQPPFSFGEFLTTVVDVVGARGTELVWTAPEFLLEQGLTTVELPLWAGDSSDIYIGAVDPARAVEAGLSPRTLAQTVAETHHHELADPTPVPQGIGLSTQRETELLALYGSS